jgi:hypothetical protein
MPHPIRDLALSRLKHGKVGFMKAMHHVHQRIKKHHHGHRDSLHTVHKHVKGSGTPAVKKNYEEDEEVGGRVHRHIKRIKPLHFKI